LAADRGFRWLGPEVPDTKTKTQWECEQGHKWEARYNDIHQEYGCPYCAIERVADQKRNKPDDYHALATTAGLLWLGPEVPNVNTKTGWECEQGHQWEACYNDIQQGNRCPHCAGTMPKTPGDYHALAAARGFRWLGPEVPNTGTRTWWECDQGHRWEARYDNIKQGTSCPSCADMIQGTRVSKPQRELCEMLGGDLNHPFGRYSIDIALRVHSMPIAIEYDAWYWHAGRGENDAQREEELTSAGWRVLRVKSNTQLPTHEQLDAALDRLLMGERQVEIVLDDWGKGPTRAEID
jgi:hypothetical protein